MEKSLSEKTKIERWLGMPIDQLMFEANQVRKQLSGRHISTCTIMNAKSGRCSEDCKFCAQSGHHTTQVDVYDLKSKEEIVAAAKNAKHIGSSHFGIVTSGNRLDSQEFATVLEAVRDITSDVKMCVCGSLGAMSEMELAALRHAGMVRYHHNIETSRNFYPRIVSAHTYDERLKTIYAAKKAGMEICSGGIIGLGETMQDRVDMALTLKELDVDSVPINILVAIPGTPLENMPPLPVDEILRTIAIFRLILQDKTIKIAAGRESVLKDFQTLAFMAGANSMLIGGYLTTRGRDVETDRKMIQEIEKIW